MAPFDLRRTLSHPDAEIYPQTHGHRAYALSSLLQATHLGANPMTDESLSTSPNTVVATRTLIVAGFHITNVERHPQHIDYFCERSDALGAGIRYLISVCETDEPPLSDVENIHRTAEADGRVLVVVARIRGEGWMSWNDFLDALGGPVPSWRALGPSYADVLGRAAQNETPQGMEGQGWQIFEDAVSDGFEFILGRLVRRLGGRRRGKPVSDLITETPDGRILVIDAKASKEPYSVTRESIRPLVEYVRRQQDRQRGHASVGGAILVASSFSQGAERLGEVGNDFLAQTSVPLAFLHVETLLPMVERLRHRPDLRNAIRWSRVFCRTSVVRLDEFTEELRAAHDERIARGQARS